MKKRLIYSDIAYKLMLELGDYPFDYPDSLKPKTQKVYPFRDIQLVEPFWIEFPFRDKVMRMDIAMGFICDGGSVPRSAWWVDAPLGYGLPGYLFHDGAWMSELIDRKSSDIMLAQILLLDEKLSMWRRSVIYHSVNMFGGPIWNAHTKEMIEYGRRYVSVYELEHNTHGAIDYHYSNQHRVRV